MGGRTREAARRTRNGADDDESTVFLRRFDGRARTCVVVAAAHWVSALHHRCVFAVDSRHRDHHRRRTARRWRSRVSRLRAWDAPRSIRSIFPGFRSGTDRRHGASVELFSQWRRWEVRRCLGWWDLFRRKQTACRLGFSCRSREFSRWRFLLRFCANAACRCCESADSRAAGRWSWWLDAT